MKVLNARYYIYRHIRPDTAQVFYVGLGSYGEKKNYQRAHSIKNRNKHWKNIVNKCEGIFKVEIMVDNLSKENAVIEECRFIKLYGRKDLDKGYLCNMTDGGEGVKELSEESRKMISNKRLGVKNPMYGKNLSKEALLKKSVAMSGKNNHNFGKALPDYQKEINRKAQTGRKDSGSTILNRCKNLKKEVVDTTLNIMYDSIQDVANQYGYSCSHMTRLIKSNYHNLKFVA